MFNSCNFCRRFAGPKVLVLFTLLPVIVLPCAAQQLGEVTMEMISGATLAGTIEKIEPTGLVVGKGIPLDCQIDQIASIKTRHVENPRGTSKVQIRLIGGGVINAGDELLLSPLREEIKKMTWSVLPHPQEVKFASLGGDSGSVGAAAVAIGIGE